MLREALADARPALGRDRGPAQGRADPVRRQRDGRHRPPDSAHPAAGPRPGGRGAAALLHRGRPWTTWPATTSSSPPTAPAPRSASSVSATRVVGSGSTVETATAKFIWFGTDYLFDGLTFVHERGPDGVFAVHGYPISRRGLARSSWRPTRSRGGGPGSTSSTSPSRPGASDMVSKEYLEKLFADQIDGRQLLVNNSRWGNFRTRRSQRWHDCAGPRRGPAGGVPRRRRAHRPLLGRLRHQDGDGGRDRAGATLWPGTPDDLPAALAAYEAAAQPSVREDPGRGAAEPVLVGALRPLPRRVRALAVRLPLPVPQHHRRSAGAARLRSSSRAATGVGSRPTVRSRCRRRSSGPVGARRGAWSRWQPVRTPYPPRCPAAPARSP